MTKEQQFFLKMLADHLNGRKLEDNEQVDINWNDLMSVADIHEMSDLIYYQCRAYMSTHPELEMLNRRLGMKQAAHMHTVINRQQDFAKLEKVFREHEIVFFPFKGNEIARYYPVPTLRVCGDVDIMMHTEDREKAHVLLEAAGYKAASTGENHEWGYHKQAIHYELHDHMLFKMNTNTPEGIAFCDHCWEYVSDNADTTRKTLDISFHFVYLLLHLRKHMLYEGVGFRQFYDLAVLAVNAAEELNWSWIKEELEKIHMLQFGQTCLQFCEKWFDVKASLGEIEISADFFEQATQKIFGNGVFGYDDEENRGNANLNALRESGKKKVILNYLFPSYENVVGVSYYSFVKGRKWLLPVVWVYRLYRVFRYRKSTESVRIVADTMNSDEKFQARELVLKQWGL